MANAAAISNIQDVLQAAPFLQSVTDFPGNLERTAPLGEL